MHEVGGKKYQGEAAMRSTLKMRAGKIAQVRLEAIKASAQEASLGSSGGTGGRE
jgi:hypothetical protein